MESLGQRILKRAVPVGLTLAAFGVVLRQGFLFAVQALTEVKIREGEGPVWQGPVLLGLAGFGIMAAIECARRGRKPAVKPVPETSAVL